MVRVSGSSGSGSGGMSRDGGARAQTFRRTHRVGQTVRGRVLRRERRGLAWVNIDGQDLLAGVASDHEPGHVLFFLIEQLSPEIVLRELRLPMGASGSTAGLVLGFKADLARFESLLAAVCDVGVSDGGETQSGPLPPAAERRQRFLANVAASGDLLHAYTSLLVRERAICERLAKSASARYCYAPWLLPGASCQEVLVLAGGEELAEIRYGFSLAPLGGVQLRMLHGRGAASCRVLLERPEMTRPLEAVLGVLMNALELPRQLDYLGVAPLPPSPAGVLEGVLAPDQTPYVGINRRV